MTQKGIKFRWIREGQYTRWGLINRDDVVDSAKRGIPEDVVKIWIRDGWAEEIKPEVKAKPETSTKSKVKES